MARVVGRVLFDAQRTAAAPGSMQGIASVPVVLQDRVTNVRLAVTTDSSGGFEFFNVPDGDYRIVESYREPAVPSPGDFNLAVPGDVPAGVVPPVSYAPNPPSGATDLDCTAPNTLHITVSGGDVLNQYILNGPVRYIPIESVTDACAVISPHNLLQAAVHGTMGTLPAGTPANTGVPYEPFPDNVPDFTYVLPQVEPGHSPEDGEYTVQNIMNDDHSNVLGAWWRIADHTTGNETGLMMVVNGDTPGSAFYTEDVAVEPNTLYLFSAWMLNMFKVTGWVDPALGVRIVDQNGHELYSETLGANIPVNTAMPEWKQIGTVINSFDNTMLTVQFLSEGEDAIGNDYAIDDLAFQEISVPVFVPHIVCSERNIEIGETAVYTVTLHNTCSSPLLELMYRNAIPDGLTFIPGSVTIDGLPVPEADPEAGFPLPNIPGDGIVTITFRTMAEFLPQQNPTETVAEAEYKYTPVVDGILMQFNVESNTALLRIDPPWCEIDSAILQRENNTQDSIPAGGIIPFESPLILSGDIVYRPDGGIDIERGGAYAICWFVAGLTGLGLGGQSYALKKFNYDTETWDYFAGVENHIKTATTLGFAIVTVNEEEIEAHGKATAALFNNAGEKAQLTPFSPKAGIFVWGSDFGCVRNRMMTVDYGLSDVNYHMQQIARFLYLSEVTELDAPAEELAGLGVAVIFVGFNYNFWGIGSLSEAQTLSAGGIYYLMEVTQYPAMLNYQGETTFGTLWVMRPGEPAVKYPIRFDESGIYIIPTTPLTLPSGTRLSFTESIILAEPQ